jgi:hypothetical protein
MAHEIHSRIDAAKPGDISTFNKSKIISAVMFEKVFRDGPAIGRQSRPRKADHIGSPF